jgi:galactokinase
MIPENRTLVESADSLGRRFQERFGETPRVYSAPGRVNLIGEHTDYNDGFVMPAAIGFRTQIAVALRRDRKLVIYSENYAEQVEFDLDNLPPTRASHWSDYALGVAEMVVHSGVRLRGANLLVSGDVPQGAGLSSSASIEVAVGFTLLDLVGEPIDLTQLALLAQRAENEFVGAKCGIMDQFVSTHGKLDQALLLDCRSLDYRLLPLAGVPLVISNTMVKHSLSQGEYNERRAECEEGVRKLAQHLPTAKALRDVTLDDLDVYGHELSDKVLRRCRHVITENTRCLQAADALDAGDLPAFGALMRQSHTSLRDDFEVSCAELDLMVELGEQVDGVYGTRMTGGGFGGCTITLMKSECVPAFQTSVSAGYEKVTGRIPEIYVCSAADGVGRIV